MKISLFLATTFALCSLCSAGYAAPVKIVPTAKAPQSAKEFKIVLRAVRIHVAADGTKAQEVVGNNVARGTAGIRLRAQIENIQYYATPRVNADNTIDLRLKAQTVKNFARNDKTFFYQDALRSTSKLKPNIPVQFAAIAETDDTQVIASLQNRTPLPTTGSPYSVLFLHATAQHIAK